MIVLDSTYPKARGFFFASSAIFVAYEILDIKISPEAGSKIASIDARIVIGKPELISTVIFLAMAYFIFRLISEWNNDKNNFDFISMRVEVLVAYFIFLISIYFQVEVLSPGLIGFSYHVFLSVLVIGPSCYYGFKFGDRRSIKSYIFLVFSLCFFSLIFCFVAFNSVRT